MTASRLPRPAPRRSPPGPDPSVSSGASASSGAARRLTKQQAAVAAMLHDSEDFTSAQDLHARLRASGNPVGLATVYRTLQALAGEGEVDVLRTDDGEAVYRRCSTGHHHHLVCRSCGRAVEVLGPTVERWADAVSAEHGFRDVRHTVEIVGTCADCPDD